ncbi:acyl-CoA dehydrogenase family protein [[Mycobacterium] wendilense]|uniref:Acyl-CoA dehydrogenase family protein n=1 Tax=[Mycobacterium] wendilense TaxID=3064284 RepID=A0ABN9P831_9MYCO|nr:acyl-CoA dehydrogenase family protein [Mycolicibacterium sp. MU0050]CAJ1586384.1 acyl-CoA dehydrogenase family protein [Mycolicibacterium sp. MU0050]
MTNEIKALREAVSGLMQKRSSEAQVRELMATDTGLDEGTWADLTDMGLLGLTIDEQFGGAGAGHVEMSAVCEEMGRALLCGPFFSTAVLTPALLTATGDADEAAQVLPTIADGTSVTALAFAEGTSATLPGELGTTASAAGDQWQLTGEKNYVLDAGAADVLYVLAGTADGPAVFAVSRGAAGFEAVGLTGVDLTRKLHRVRFSGTPARLVGEPGSGAASFAAALETGGVAMLGEQAGGTYHAMQMAVDYARTRFQFGRAIGSFQAVKHMCADMLLEAESAVSAARHVAAAYDAGDDNRAADLALAQAYCGDAYVTVAATSIQVHGGIGFTWEHPAHLYLRRARTDAQLLGDPAWHRERYLQLKGA